MPTASWRLPHLLHHIRSISNSMVSAFFRRSHTFSTTPGSLPASCCPHLGNSRATSRRFTAQCRSHRGDSRSCSKRFPAQCRPRIGDSQALLTASGRFLAQCRPRLGDRIWAVSNPMSTAVWADLVGCAERFLAQGPPQRGLPHLILRTLTISQTMSSAFGRFPNLLDGA